MSQRLVEPGPGVFVRTLRLSCRRSRVANGHVSYQIPDVADAAVDAAD
jgi:hypothetical protein